ncbi:MAG: Rieske (2Fe-2S) protein [Pseudomonadales bacterium]
MNKHILMPVNSLIDRTSVYALVANVDLVVVRYDDEVSVLYGRCAHRGALMSDGYVDGNNLICGVHGWDYRFDTGVSEYNNSEVLNKFTAWVEDGQVCVDADEIAAWELKHPQSHDREAYQGLYQDHVGTEDEPHVHLISQLAAEGLSTLGHHGPMGAMDVSRTELPVWEDIQLNVAQLHRMPLLDDARD